MPAMNMLSSFLGSIFGGELAKKALDVAMGKGFEVAGEIVQARLKIQKGGKGLEDEIIFCEVTLDPKVLKVPYQKKLDTYLLHLKKHDTDNGTNRHADFILFIATGAELFEKKKIPTEEKPGAKKVAGKEAKETIQEVRITKRGTDFIKAMLDYSNEPEKQMEFCLNRRVFDEKIEKRNKKVASLLKKGNKFALDTLKISSWNEFDFQKIKEYDCALANRIEDARIKRSPQAVRGEEVKDPSIKDIFTFWKKK